MLSGIQYRPRNSVSPKAPAFGKLDTASRNGLLFTYEVKLPTGPGEPVSQTGGGGEVSTTVAELLKQESGADISIVTAASARLANYVERHHWKKLDLKISVPLRAFNQFHGTDLKANFSVYQGKTDGGVPVYVLASDNLLLEDEDDQKFHRYKLKDVTYDTARFDAAIPVLSEAFMYFAEYLDRSLSACPAPGLQDHVHDPAPAANDSHKKSKVDFWLVNSEMGFLSSLKKQHPELNPVGVTSLVHSLPISFICSNLDPETVARLYGHDQQSYVAGWQNAFHPSAAASAVFNADSLILNALHYMGCLINKYTGGTPGTSFENTFLNKPFSLHPAKFSLDYHIPAQYSIRTNPLFNQPNAAIADLGFYQGSWVNNRSHRANAPTISHSLRGLPESYRPALYTPNQPLTGQDSQALLAFKNHNKTIVQQLLGLRVDKNAPLFLTASRMENRTKNINLILSAMDRLMQTHPDAQFVLSSHQLPDVDEAEQRKLIDALQTKYPDRFRYVDGRPEAFQLLLGASTYSIITSNTESFGTSDLYAAGMGTPNVAAQTEGILTKFYDPAKKTDLDMVDQTLRDYDPESAAAYSRVKSYGQTAIFLSPFNNPEVMRHWMTPDRERGTAPPAVAECESALYNGLETAYRMFRQNPHDYAQLVHNNIKMTSELFSPQMIAGRLENPINSAISAARNNRWTNRRNTTTP